MNKKLLGLVALLALATTSVKAANPQLPYLYDANNGPSAQAQNAEFLGNSGVCRVETSTPTLVAISCPGTSGKSGIIYEVTNTSGTAADAAIALDVAVASLPAATGAGFDTNGVKISPLVLSAGSSATGCTTQATCEDWKPIRPTRFSNGLALMRRGTSNAEIYYRLDADNAASPVTK